MATEPTAPGATTVHVSGRRADAAELTRELRGLAVAVPLFVVAPLLRHWHRRWGATDAEVSAVMPGDERAPTADVWAWLVQAGFGKAGFPSVDLLDNVAHPSADRILEEHQDPQVGDWVPMFSKVNDTTAFKVAQIDPHSRLVWRKPDSTRAWALSERDGATRLVTRLRIQYRWGQPLGAMASRMLNEFGDFPMMRRMLLNVTRRAEGAARRYR